MKRKLSLLLAALTLALSLSACGGIGRYAEQGTPSPAPTDAAQAAGSLDYAAAYAAFAPDDVVMTINGTEVKWSEYYYWLYYMLYSMESQLGSINSLDEVYPYGDGVQTYGEFARDTATSVVTQYHVLETSAKDAGVTLTQEDQDAIDQLLASDITSVCGEGATEEQFWQELSKQYVTPENYRYINEIACLYSRCFAHMFGEAGEKLGAEDAMAFGEDSGYVYVKHILVSTVDAEGAELGDEAKAEKLKLAEKVRGEAAAATGSARETTFTDLMNEYSEDTGLAAYPDGYCYAPGTMATQFEEAAAALGENEISDPVETQFGYHIIMRLPLSPETVVFDGSGGNYTIRYLAAQSAYDTVMGGWIDSAETEFTPAFDGLSVSAIFA